MKITTAIKIQDNLLLDGLKEVLKIIDSINQSEDEEVTICFQNSCFVTPIFILPLLVYTKDCKKRISYENLSSYMNTSHLIYNYSNRSNKLFPEDILVEKVNFINKSNVFTFQSLELTRKIFYSNMSDKDWAVLVEASGLQFQKDSIISFSNKEVDNFYKKWKRNNMDEFFKNVLYRKVFTGDNKEIEPKELL